MWTYTVKRVFLFAPTIFIVTLIVFFIIWILPGDPALVILTGGSDDVATIREQDLEKLQHELGLDRPIYVRYADWMWGLLRGDLGNSIWYTSPVMDDLKDRFPVSIQLAVMSIIIAVLFAVPLGVLSAVKQDTWIDYIARLFTIAGVALPTFWVGVLIVFVLAFWFNWLPPLGYATLWEDPMTNLQQLAFPAAALGFHDVAFIARMTRSSMLEVLRDDYVRTARSKGLNEWAVVFPPWFRKCFVADSHRHGFAVRQLAGRSRSYRDHLCGTRSRELSDRRHRPPGLHGNSSYHPDDCGNHRVSKPLGGSPLRLYRP